MGLEGAVGGRAAFQWWRRTRRRAVAAEDVDDGGCGGLEGRGGSRTDVNLAVPAPARCSTRQQGKGGCGAVGRGRVTRVGGGGGDAARFLGNDDGSDGRWRPQAIRGSGGVGKSGAQPRERSGAGERAGGGRRAAPRRRIGFPFFFFGGGGFFSLFFYHVGIANCRVDPTFDIKPLDEQI
ncbi:hypothetical protein OsI_12498 [Oryza sativa Indica Group]|uniref:Uncharacterized protein n=1 Tax=Oryza sativa subsp. indica TaxID=39946 RepID=B8ALR0_ORYSI|nr:hypothetical protein OsI_12498 [Oryza sativa Indica Group]